MPMYYVAQEQNGPVYCRCPGDDMQQAAALMFKDYPDWLSVWLKEVDVGRVWWEHKSSDYYQKLADDAAAREKRNAKARMNQKRRAAAMDSIGMKRVKGSLGGHYWE